MAGARQPVWTVEDEEKLIEAYNKRMPIGELEKMFPERSRKAILRKIEKLQEEGTLGKKFPRGTDSTPTKKDSWNDSWGSTWNDSWNDKKKDW